MEPQAPEEDPSCAFWSMVFSFICCVGCISFCINCGAAPGSKRLRYARIGCAISCVVGKWGVWLSGLHEIDIQNQLEEHGGLLTGPFAFAPPTTALVIIGVLIGTAAAGRGGGGPPPGAP